MQGIGKEQWKGVCGGGGSSMSKKVRERLCGRRVCVCVCVFVRGKDVDFLLSIHLECVVLSNGVFPQTLDQIVPHTVQHVAELGKQYDFERD